MTDRPDPGAHWPLSGPHPTGAGGLPGARPRSVEAVLVLAVAGVCLLTLTPTGAGGWEWGPPWAELRWYATGLGSPWTVLQLLGNLVLLAPPAAAVVLCWPRWRRIGDLLPLAVGAAVTIEVLQWVLPLGRVVSPIDAVLNATGALVAGVLAGRRTVGQRRPASGERTRPVW